MIKSAEPKRLLFVVIFFLSLFSSSASDIYTCVNVNGYWSNWVYRSMMVYGRYSSIQIGGYNDDYRLCEPWDYSFKFTINNYHAPTKKELKYHYKNNIWFEYSGTVEYWVNDEYPTIEAVFRNFKWPAIAQTGKTIRAKRTAKAIIRIAPYKKHPKIYNIIFDNVGFAIDLKNCHWDKNE